VAPHLVALCGLKHVPTRHGAAFTVAGVALALFRAGDRVWAVEDRNPYTGCGVAGGRLSRVGHTPVVVSPLYHLVFDLRTGACLNAIDLPQQRLRTCPVEVVADVVHVDVSALRPHQAVAVGVSA
jgi:nitrite reductase/ring-hydroxylating ferredoxin subunit